jgi:hypothetical protein
MTAKNPQPCVDDSSTEYFRTFQVVGRPLAGVECSGRTVNPVPLVGYGFQKHCDGMRNARLKREDAFSHAMIIVSSAMVSSS